MESGAAVRARLWENAPQLVYHGRLSNDTGSDLLVGTNAEIWIVNDGKPGHLNQSLGLAEAIQAIRPGLSISLRTPVTLWQALRLAFSKAAESPALLIAAGHRTHGTLLALKRATGAPAVVMMKPSLPMSLFDLCLIPQHDNPPLRRNVLSTTGALNRVQAGPSVAMRATQMILVGGPSDHFVWDGGAILKQIDELRSQGGRWLVATSRRTPQDVIAALEKRCDEMLELVQPEAVSRDWLPQQLGTAALCWVTPDSVSMVYEALTAGAAVGLLELKPVAKSRVAQGIAKLVADSGVATIREWRCGVSPRAIPGFNEAARCAVIVSERLLPPPEIMP